jgi:hypothetical protein
MKRTSKRWIQRLTGLALCLSACATTGFASQDVFHPNLTTTQWRTHIHHAPVAEVHVWVHRASNQADTYFNMRFGRDGHTFDGRRVYFHGRNQVKASWNLHGRQADGNELILNTYNGSVHVEKIVVVYEDGRRQHHGPRDQEYGYSHDDSNDRHNDQVGRRLSRNDRYGNRYESRRDRNDNRGDRYGNDGAHAVSHGDHCPSDCSCRPHQQVLRFTPRYGQHYDRGFLVSNH